MKVTVGETKLSEGEVKDLPLIEVKRRVAKAEGKPVPPLTEPEIAQSEARKRLEKLKAQRSPIIEPFEYEGETFYIKRLTYQQLIDLALSVSRDGHNVLNIHNEDGVRSVTIAVLRSCVCNADSTPYFTQEDAEDYLDSADDAALVSALFARCNEANPDIFSTLKKG